MSRTTPRCWKGSAVSSGRLPPSGPLRPSEPGERIVAWALSAYVKADPEWDRTSTGEVLLEGWKEITECALATGQQRMHVPSLRRPRPVGRLSRQGVALQHDHVLEVIGERGRGRQSAYSGSNYDRLFADGSGHDHHLRAQTVGAPPVQEMLARGAEHTML